ncbi:unnamed protein product, partial [Brassica oleracea var. botrytis]
MTNTKYPNLSKKNTSRPQTPNGFRVSFHNIYLDVFMIRRPRPTKSEAGERNPKASSV